MDNTVQVTSELLWRAAFIMALIDIPLVIVIGWRVSSELFRKLKWHLAVFTFIVYAGLWGTVGSVIFWDAVYKLIFPAWFRWLLPGGYGVLFGLVALLFWRVSLAFKRWQPAWFCLLGGLVSLVGHTIGISRGLMQVPMLSEASAASALVFGIFEFTFYWCVILGAAVLVHKVWRKGRPTSDSKSTA